MPLRPSLALTSNSAHTKLPQGGQSQRGPDHVMAAAIRYKRRRSIVLPESELQMNLQLRATLFLSSKQTIYLLLSSSEQLSHNHRATSKSRPPNPPCLIAQMHHWPIPTSPLHMAGQGAGQGAGECLACSSLQMPKVINTSPKYFPLPSPRFCREQTQTVHNFGTDLFFPWSLPLFNKQFVT